MAEKKLKIKAELDTTDVNQKISKIKNLLKFDVILNGLKSAFSVIKGMFSSLASEFDRVFKFEKATIQFKNLIGSIEEARQHMADLREMGMTPPFSLEEFQAASVQMMKLSGGVLGYKESLTLVGDAASALGVNIEQLGMAYARTYAMIRDGVPIGRATNELVRMGVITPGVAEQLKSMQQNGSSLVEIWNELNASMAKFNGSMDEFAESKGGKIDTMISKFQNMKQIMLENIVDPIDTAVKDFSKLNSYAAKFGETIGKAGGAVLGLINKILPDEVVKSQYTGSEDEIVGGGDLTPEEKAKAQLAEAQKVKEAEQALAEELARNEEVQKKWLEGFKDDKKNAEKSLQLQKSLVEQLGQAIIQSKQTLTGAYSSAITSSGKIGGYQSYTEMGFAQKMPSVDNQLVELQKQTNILNDIKEKISTAEEGIATFS